MANLPATHWSHSKSLPALNRPGAQGLHPEEPAAVVVSATTAQQQVLDTTLGRMEADIAESGLEPPAILCIGEGVRLREGLDWQALAVGLSPALRPAMAAC